MRVVVIIAVIVVVTKSLTKFIYDFITYWALASTMVWTGVFLTFLPFLVGAGWVVDTIENKANLSVLTCKYHISI